MTALTIRDLSKRNDSNFTQKTSELVSNQGSLIGGGGGSIPLSPWRASADPTKLTKSKFFS